MNGQVGERSPAMGRCFVLVKKAILIGASGLSADLEGRGTNPGVTQEQRATNAFNTEDFWATGSGSVAEAEEVATKSSVPPDCWYVFAHTADVARMTERMCIPALLRCKNGRRRLWEGRRGC
jgi:hypothetical protein